MCAGGADGASVGGRAREWGGLSVLVVGGRDYRYYGHDHQEHRGRSDMHVLRLLPPAEGAYTRRAGDEEDKEGAAGGDRRCSQQ